VSERATRRRAGVAAMSEARGPLRLSAVILEYENGGVDPEAGFLSAERLGRH
jgi:hypothetical protein